jgi:hypothetical protein
MPSSSFQASSGTPQPKRLQGESELPCPPSPRQRHLFIVGFYRSGTTLLYSLLNLHPQIRLVYEADILGNPLVESSAYGLHKWWELLDFYNGCMQRHRLTANLAWTEAKTIRQRADLLYRQYAGEGRAYIAFTPRPVSS